MRGSPSAGSTDKRANPIGHPPPADHRAGDPGDDFQVALRPGGDDVEHFVFGRHPAQRADDPAAQVVGVVAVAVGVRRGQRHAERPAAWNDRHLSNRVGARQQHAEQRVAGFVVRGAASFVFGNHDVAGGAKLNFLQRIGQVALVARRVSPRRAASNAASLTRFARSAPVMPGVEAAS